MGHIIMPAAGFLASLSEGVGARSGIALDEEGILSHLGDASPLYNQLKSDGFLRVASDTYADCHGDLLYALGTTEAPGMPTLAERLMNGLGDDWQSLFSLGEMLQIEAVANHCLRERNGKSSDLEDAQSMLRSLVNGKGAAGDLLNVAMSEHLAFHPYFTCDLPNVDQVSLKKLFESEDLPTNDDEFFDRRFIDYLSRHPDLLGEIHWRQFEQLAAEWLQYNGYLVELGAGRNDGGVDIRAWSDTDEPGTPPAIIVQCKRQKAKVDRVVVKALYADVLHENAESGMVITSSDISDGAKDDIRARAYPITAANRQQVLQWIEKMKTPDTGIISAKYF